MGILCDLIVSAKDKNKDSLMEIINKFRPLIKKQAYALNYEDAENDLIVDMIELIYNMPFFQHDGQAVTYISTSIRHSYVKFLKQRIRLRENECIYDPDIIKNIENLSEDFEKKDLDLLFAIRKLNYNQKWVIIYKFFFMFKDKEIMNKLNISRDEAFACIRYLDTLGYIECTYKNIGFNFLLGFRASHKGYNYAEFWRLQLLEEILKSVLLPVVVSILTSLLITA